MVTRPARTHELDRRNPAPRRGFISVSWRLRLIASFALVVCLLLPTAFGFLASSASLSGEVLELGWKGVVRQASPNSCGPAVLATLLAMQGATATDEEIASRTELAPDGMSLGEFSRVSGELGMPGRWLRVGNTLEVGELPTPSVVHLSESSGHFVILVRYADGFVQLADPARGNVLVRRTRFLRDWTRRLFVFDGPLVG